jgi:hypothetical protein
MGSKNKAATKVDIEQVAVEVDPMIQELRDYVETTSTQPSDALKAFDKIMGYTPESPWYDTQSVLTSVLTRLRDAGSQERFDALRTDWFVIRDEVAQRGLRFGTGKEKGGINKGMHDAKSGTVDAASLYRVIVKIINYFQLRKPPQKAEAKAE